VFRSVVTLFISLYILLGRSSILAFLDKLTRALLKEETGERLRHYGRRGNEIFFRFISSQVLDAIIMGSMVGIVTWIMGVQYGALLAVIIGIANMIPVLGSIFATGLISIITLFTGGFAQALWLLGVVIILQQIDANVINPRLVGSFLKMSPILIITSVIVFGEFFGILGMFLAVPVVAIIKEIIEDYLDSRIIAKNK